MTTTITFAKSVPMTEAGATAELALLAVIGIYGEERASREVDLKVKGRTVTFGSDSIEAKTFKLIYVEFIDREFGRGSFIMETSNGTSEQGNPVL